MRVSAPSFAIQQRNRFNRSFCRTSTSRVCTGERFGWLGSRLHHLSCQVKGTLSAHRKRLFAVICPAKIGLQGAGFNSSQIKVTAPLGSFKEPKTSNGKWCTQPLHGQSGEALLTLSLSPPFPQERGVEPFQNEQHQVYHSTVLRQQRAVRIAARSGNGGTRMPPW